MKDNLKKNEMDDQKFLDQVVSNFSKNRGRKINEANRINLFKHASNIILANEHSNAICNTIVKANNSPIEYRKAFCAILIDEIFKTYTDNQKAAIFGYIGAESGWMSAVLNNNPHKAFASEKKGSGAFGYGQWLYYSRVLEFAKFIQSRAKAHKIKSILFLDPYTQLLFIKHEIEQKYYRSKMKKFFSSNAPLSHCVRDFKTYFGGHTDALYSEAPYEKKAKEFKNFRQKRNQL